MAAFSRRILCLAPSIIFIDEIDAKILKELQKLIGRELEVKILDLSQRDEQVILSEKAKEADKKMEILKNYKAGDEVEGEISGITNFGAFIKFGEGLEGLIHISELDWKIIKDPSEVVKVGDKIKAKIIDISNGKHKETDPLKPSNPYSATKAAADMLGSVGCEACHGSAVEHIRVCRKAVKGKPPEEKPRACARAVKEPDHRVVQEGLKTCSSHGTLMGAVEVPFYISIKLPKGAYNDN
jgi:predicted RNA-binding protein with RPS1 domain